MVSRRIKLATSALVGVRGYLLDHSGDEIVATAREDDEGHHRGLPSLRVNRVGEEDRDYVHASTAYATDDGASRSGRANLQTSIILRLSKRRRDRNSGHVR